MTLPTCATTITAVSPSGEPLANVPVQAYLTAPEAYQGLVVPGMVSGTTNAQGVCVLNLWPNVLGSAGSRYVVMVGGVLPEQPLATVYARIPNQPACNLHEHTVTRGGVAPVVLQAPAPGGFSVQRVSDTVLRLSLVGADGVTRYEDISLSQFTSAGVQPPTLASIEAYRTSATTWKAVPWGGVTWVESGITYSQVVDIYKPAVTIPNAPFIVRCHAASSEYDIAPGSSMDISLVQKASAAGIWVFALSARHPYLSSTPTNFYDEDFGRGVQFIRSLAPALGFDPAKFYAYTQSRGSGMMIQALLPDLADPNASTYAGQQSSRGLKLCWSINPQSRSRSLLAGQKFLTDQTQINLLLAAYPDDTRQRDAAALVLTADEAAVPLFVAQYDTPYQADKVTYAVMQANGGVTHYPNQGKDYREAYVARGMRDRIVVTDQATGFANVTEDFVPVIQAIEAGLSLPWAVAIARAARLGHSLLAIPQSLQGIAVNSDGTGGVPAVGAGIGGIADKSQGIANTSLVGGAGQQGVNKKPKLAAIGANYGALFDSTDQLVCFKANSGAVGCLVGWTTAGMFTAVAAQDSASVTWSAGDTNTQTLAVVGGAPLSVVDRRIYSSLASHIAGADLYAATT